MEKSINSMVNRIAGILDGNKASICLFGSVVLNDFKLGWSDIDFICLTEKSVSTLQATELVNLREKIMQEYEGNPYFRLFEGGILSLKSYINKTKDTVIYWGTRGQTITDTYELDPFSKIELLENGHLLIGDDFRQFIVYPSRQEIMEAVRNHYFTIRKHAKETGESIKSCGWILDIARCLYTINTLKVVAKTEAVEWAIKEGLFPDDDIMKKVINIRNNPLRYQNDSVTTKWAATLGPYIQKLADILEQQLNAKHYL